MKKILIVLLSIGVISCSKSESSDEGVKIDPLEITHKLGEGALLVGSTVDGKIYDLKLTSNDKTLTGFILGAAKNESPVKCRLTKNSRVYQFHTPAGKYSLEVISRGEGNKSWKIDVEIKDGQCISLNADGYAW